MNELALFAGAGGGILGGIMHGWRTRCAVEVDSYCRGVLLQRQLDGALPRFPIWDDVRTFDGKPWRGHIDVVSGGFPCQDISSAGKRKGIEGTRSGLWFEMERIIGEVRPKFAFIENSPNLRARGLRQVLSGLAGMGYNAAWGVLGDCHAGGATIRARMWLVAWDDDQVKRAQSVNAKVECAQESQEVVSDTDRLCVWTQSRRRCWEDGKEAIFDRYGIKDARDLQHIAEGNSNGLSRRVDRARATGNAQVPLVAAMAWDVLSGIIRD